MVGASGEQHQSNVCSLQWEEEKLLEQKYSEDFISWREQIKGSCLDPRGFAVAISHPGPCHVISLNYFLWLLKKWKSFLLVYAGYQPACFWLHCFKSGAIPLKSLELQYINTGVPRAEFILLDGCNMSSGHSALKMH